MQPTHMKFYQNCIYFVREYIKRCLDLMMRPMRLIRGVDKDDFCAVNEISAAAAAATTAVAVARGVRRARRV